MFARPLALYLIMIKVAVQEKELATSLLVSECTIFVTLRVLLPMSICHRSAYFVGFWLCDVLVNGHSWCPVSFSIVLDPGSNISIDDHP